MDSTTLINLHASWYTDNSPDKLEALLNAVRAAALTASREFGDAANDIAQNVTIKVWRNLCKFQPLTVDAFAKWVSVIIKNERRQYTDRPKHISADELPEHAVEDHSYVDLGTIPDSLQQACSLLEQGYTLKGAAVKLGIKPSTLRQRFNAYRKKSSRVT
jgi:DNA-directed RNA polymerase specialized sigma24 family protein